MRVGTELGPAPCTSTTCTGGTSTQGNTRRLPVWKDFPGLWEAIIGQTGGRAQELPVLLLTARSMQYAWGANAGIQLDARKWPITSPATAASTSTAVPRRNWALPMATRSKFLHPSAAVRRQRRGAPGHTPGPRCC